MQIVQSFKYLSLTKSSLCFFYPSFSPFISYNNRWIFISRFFFLYENKKKTVDILLISFDEFQKYVCYYNCNNKFFHFFLPSSAHTLFACDLKRDLLNMPRTDTWPEIHLFAIVIYAGWQIICIKIPLKRAVHDVMHRNACIEDASKRWGMKSLNVSIEFPFFRSLELNSIAIKSNRTHLLFTSPSSLYERRVAT